MELFAEEGLGVQTQEIANRAGLGAGTLFRHFATKEALLDAAGEVQLRELVDRFDEARREPDPGGCFERLVWHLIGQHTRYRAVPRLMGKTCSAEVEQLKAALYEALASTLAMAQQTGRLRGDVELADVMLLVTACAHVAETTSRADPAMRKRFMAVVFDGLRNSNGAALPRPARSARPDTWVSVYPGPTAHHKDH